MMYLIGIVALLAWISTRFGEKAGKHEKNRLISKARKGPSKTGSFRSSDNSKEGKTL